MTAPDRGLVCWILMMSFWVMLDDSINTDELLVGAGAAALAAFFAELVSYQAATRFRMRIESLVPAFSLPGQVVRDMVIVYHALWRRVAHGEQPPSVLAPDHPLARARPHLSAMTRLTSSGPLYSPSGISRSELSASSSAWLLRAWSTSCCLVAG